MRALIIAAGRGQRLDPFTRRRPKPLLYVAGRPILAHLLDVLPALGISDVLAVVGYLGEQIAAYLETRPGPAVKIVVQEQLLGNGHAVYAARASLEGPILILFGDTIPRADLRAAVESTTAVIGVAEVEDARPYGVAEVDGAGRVHRLVEKPAAPSSRLAVAGSYYFPDGRPLRDALDDLVAGGAQAARGGEFWFVDAIQRMIDRGEPVGTFRVERFYDCGTPDHLLTANRELLAKPVAGGDGDLVAGGAQAARGGRDGLPGAESGSVILPPCAISRQATLRDARIGPFVTVAPDTRISRARVRDAIVLPGAVLEDAVVDHAIVDVPPA